MARALGLSARSTKSRLELGRVNPAWVRRIWGRWLDCGQWRGVETKLWLCLDFLLITNAGAYLCRKDSFSALGSVLGWVLSMHEEQVRVGRDVVC